MAAALGVGLALLYLRTGERKPLAGIVHGLAGLAGLGLLILALRGPRRGDAMGVGSFGAAASAILAAALVLGLFIPLLTRRKPRVAGGVLAAHASLAITGFVLFLAWMSIGGAAP